MSDKNHILYTIISFLLTIVILILTKCFIKKEEIKIKLIKLYALLTVIIHYSTVYTSFLSTGTIEVEETMLFPIYPCNVAMWLLLIVAYTKKQETKVFKVLSEFTFYLGVFGGIIGIVFNENYINNPNLLDWSILKGLLSHSTMILGVASLYTFGLIKIRVNNVLSVLVGLLILVLDGALIIGIYKLFKLDPPNSMYLLEIPFPNYPFITTFLIGIVSVLLCFIIAAIYELLWVEKEERWYNKLNKIIRMKRNENQ